MIRGYTREAGVRNLEREIGALCRKVARKRAEGDETQVVITTEVVATMLGAPTFLDEEIENRTKDPGVAVGLAWTPAGGEVLFIEASRMQGGGSLTLTGQLGDVMKESGRTALSWFRANAPRYTVDPTFYKDSEIHLHVPSGAIPKDGPSAGITMVTALASELTGRPVRGDLAMTGEITLVGPRAAGRRHQGEGAGGAPARHHRGDPAEAEREEHQGRSDRRAAAGADASTTSCTSKKCSRWRCSRRPAQTHTGLPVEHADSGDGAVANRLQPVRGYSRPSPTIVFMSTISPRRTISRAPAIVNVLASMSSSSSTAAAAVGVASDESR